MDYNLENFKKWPYFDQNDIECVKDVLLSGKINRWGGSKNDEFEELMKEKFDCEYAIALANGTLALELALHALEIGQGDEVIVPCRTFMATASSVAVLGAKPIVADVDFDSQNISAETILPCISPKTKAIIAVHHAGVPCKMDEILALAKAHNLYVIEDCAQAHGAMYKGKSVGSWGDIAAWSFCQDKIITTGGEGGAVTTNNKAFWEKMWSYKDHGRDYDLVFNTAHPKGFRWFLESFGSNFRLTEMQAVLGINGLNHLSDWTKKRNANADILTSVIDKFDFASTYKANLDLEKNAYYKYYFKVDSLKTKNKKSLEQIIDEISSYGVPCMNGTCWNISLEKCFANKNWSKQENLLPNAAKLRDSAIMLLVHPTLQEADMLYYASVLEKVLAIS